MTQWLATVFFFQVLIWGNDFVNTMASHIFHNKTTTWDTKVHKFFIFLCMSVAVNGNRNHPPVYFFHPVTHGRKIFIRELLYKISKGKCNIHCFFLSRLPWCVNGYRNGLKNSKLRTCLTYYLRKKRYIELHVFVA